MRVHPTGDQATRCIIQHPISTTSIPEWTLLFFARCLPLAAACPLAAWTSVLAAEVLVVTDRVHPIRTTHDARIIELDDPARIEAELAAQLPSDPQQAAAIVQQRLKSGGADLQRRLAAAYQDVVDAWSLGIVKLPAIVVDRRHVVYGEPDIDRAVAKIKEYRSAHP